MKIIFGTTNAHKLAEASAILQMELEWYSHEDLTKIEHMFPGGIPEIQSMDILEIVKQKSKDAYTATWKPVMVEDTGLFIEAYQGFPGPFIKYIIEWPGLPLVFKMMDGVENRTVRAITGVALYDGATYTTGYGELEGIIVETPRWDKFWWSNAFEPIGTGKTFGEITEEEKNKISMRRIALLDFMENLKGRII